MNVFPNFSGKATYDRPGVCHRWTGNESGGMVCLLADYRADLNREWSTAPPLHPGNHRIAAPDRGSRALGPTRTNYSQGLVDPGRPPQKRLKKKDVGTTRIN